MKNFVKFASLTAAAATLAGCVVTTPLPAPQPGAQPFPQQPSQPTNVLDAASRQVARNAINSEMEKRLPGVNVAPYTTCVIDNASTPELIDIAQQSRSGSAGLADAVAGIVSRQGTAQCIASAAQGTTTA